ncbi:hypothetical protein SUGI_0981850 [Cryptomeria japonica]|nr:hypothetical protein SUGI_0981850 [Cryptomeria japonica]
MEVFGGLEADVYFVNDMIVFLWWQQGTALSTPLTVSSLSQLSSAKQQADYLQHFRADNIINDVEYMRVCIVPNEEPWTVLGQDLVTY